MPTAANVSAVARSPRRAASGGTASASSVTAASATERPTGPYVAHATPVNTIAAAPTSRPPSTNSRFCTVTGVASGALGRGCAVEVGSAAGAGASDDAPWMPPRAKNAACRTSTARSSRRCRVSRSCAASAV